MLALWLYESFWPDAYHFLSIFEGEAWLSAMLLANLCMMGNRMLQRVIFVSGYYGITQGLLSVPRLFWGNFINFMANWRAIRQIVRQGDPRRVAWDKTTHDFPIVDQENRARRLLGRLLVERGSVSNDQLESVLRASNPGLRLGGRLVHQGLLGTDVLAEAIAEQGGVKAESVNPWTIPEAIVAIVSSDVALHYAILPLRLEDQTLVVASESVIDPVALAALARKVRRPVRFVIASKGQVTVGLRHWYARLRKPDPREPLAKAIVEGRIRPESGAELLGYFVSRQVQLAEVLVGLGHISQSTLKAVLLRFERASKPLGEFLVDENVISHEALQRGLLLQSLLQPTMSALLANGDTEPPADRQANAKAST